MYQTSDVTAAFPETLDDGGAIIRHRLKVFLALAVLVGAMGYFAFMAFQGATVYYLTVEELMQRGPTAEGRVVRVAGKLVPDSFVREADSTLARFSLTDGVESIDAVHDGVLPDLFFNEHSEIILEGVYSPGSAFESQNVIVKCPSKYVAEG
jgi:cytochrome c-type biogenesis protein CcmE